MKSLARLLISHVFISIFVTFFLLSGHIEHPFLIIFLIICIISSLVYFYTLYQLFKEINQKSLI